MTGKIRIITQRVIFDCSCCVELNQGFNGNWEIAILEWCFSHAEEYVRNKKERREKQNGCF